MPLPSMRFMPAAWDRRTTWTEGVHWAPATQMPSVGRRQRGRTVRERWAIVWLVRARIRVVLSGTPALYSLQLISARVSVQTLTEHGLKREGREGQPAGMEKPGRSLPLGVVRPDDSLMFKIQLHRDDRCKGRLSFNGITRQRLSGRKKTCQMIGFPGGNQRLDMTLEGIVEV